MVLLSEANMDFMFFLGNLIRSSSTTFVSYSFISCLVLSKSLSVFTEWTIEADCTKRTLLYSF